MLEHYFHESYQFRAKRKNVHAFKMNVSSKSKSNKNPTQKFVCASNGNSIQIYKISSESVDFYMRKQFFCNIAKLQVIPSLHHESDFIFILDDLGRYSFWRPGFEETNTCNVIQKQNISKKFYREQLSPQEQEQFAGSVFRYDVKDTVGWIFFTVQNKLTVLNVSVKSKEGLTIMGTRSYEIPYTRFRYVNCLSVPSVKDSQFFVGIIQQLQEKTILKVHVLQPSDASILIDQQSLSYKLQKINLLSFRSGQKDQLIILTFDQISIFKYKQSAYLCNYRTRGNYGSVCFIESQSNNKRFSQATYIHLGFEMTVFTKNRLNNYGQLKFQGINLLQGCGIIQSKYLGHLPKGEVMIAFVTNFSEVYFVILYEHKWRIVRKIQSLASIFSLHELNSEENPESMVAVHSSLEGQTEITHLQVISPTIIEQEQTIQNRIIQTIDIIEDGQSLVICSDQQNSLLSWSQPDKKWLDHFQFPNNRQQVLACTGLHVVMTSGIYKYTCSPLREQLTMTQLFKQQNILSAVTNSQYIGYYTSQGNYKFYEFQSGSISRIRKNCIEEYIWHMLSGNNILVSAAYSEIGQLRILPVDKVARKIQLRTKEMVSSIRSVQCRQNTRENTMVDQNNNGEEKLNVDIVVGFYNGDLEIYSLYKGKTVAKFNIGSYMVNISHYRSNHLVVYTSQKQFIVSKSQSINTNPKSQTQTLSHKSIPNSVKQTTFALSSFEAQQAEYTLHQIQLSDSSQTNPINKVVYLPKFDKFLVTFYNPSYSVEKSQSSLNTATTRQLSTILQLRSLKLHKKLSENELTLQLKSAINMSTIFRTQAGEEVPYVQIVDKDQVYVALSEIIMKYDLKKKELVRKQIHLLKEIVAIQKTQNGILIAGIDLLDTGAVVLFGYQDLSIKSTFNLGQSKPSCMKSLHIAPYTNRFFVRHQTYLSLLEIQPTLLISLVKTTNTKTSGTSMDINEFYNKIILTDPYRYISVWDYDLEISSYDVLPVSKYFGAHMINDCCWLDSGVVVGDRGGKISVLEFNLGNNNDLHKMNMTKVAQIYVAEQVFTVKRVQTSVKTRIQEKQSQLKMHEQKQNQSNFTGQKCSILYGTANGSIGKIKTITHQQFTLLKRIQLDTLKYIDTKQRFSYQQWRQRIPQTDKLIDSSVINYYLNEFRMKIKINQQEFYNEVKEVYQRILKQ